MATVMGRRTQEKAPMTRPMHLAALATLAALWCGSLAASAQTIPGQLPGPPPGAPPGRPAEPAPASAAPAPERAGGQGSVWNEIMAQKVFKPCMPSSYAPNSYKDGQGKWRGFSASMAEDIAKTLNVRLEFVESSLRTMVIDLQTGRCQAILGLVITPQRAVAMDFAGPLYEPFLAMGSSKGTRLPGNKWSDIDKDTIRTSAIQGNAAVQRLEKGAPKSSKVILPSFNDAVLALQSNRADIYVGNIFELLVAQAKNGMFGEVALIDGAKPAPSFAGVRYDDDGRFARFLQHWAGYSRNTGAVTKWIVDALVETGVKREDIPASIDF